jgi:hypothetical protein
MLKGLTSQASGFLEVQDGRAVDRPYTEPLFQLLNNLKSSNIQTLQTLNMYEHMN